MHLPNSLILAYPPSPHLKMVVYTGVVKGSLVVQALGINCRPCCDELLCHGHKASIAGLVQHCPPCTHTTVSYTLTQIHN